MKFDIPAMWCELTEKIRKIKAGATPAQAAQINENRQNIAILYGVTESIQNLIPEDASVDNQLATMADIVTPAADFVEVSFQTPQDFKHACQALAAVIDWSKITNKARLVYETSSDVIQFCIATYVYATAQELRDKYVAFMEWRHAGSAVTIISTEIYGSGLVSCYQTNLSGTGVSNPSVNVNTDYNFASDSITKIKLYY